MAVVLSLLEYCRAESIEHGHSPCEDAHISKRRFFDCMHSLCAKYLCPRVTSLWAGQKVLVVGQFV